MHTIQKLNLTMYYCRVSKQLHPLTILLSTSRCSCFTFAEQDWKITSLQITFSLICWSC